MNLPIISINYPKLGSLLSLILPIFLVLTILTSCGIYKKVDARKIPTSGEERAKYPSCRPTPGACGKRGKHGKKSKAGKKG